MSKAFPAAVHVPTEVSIHVHKHGSHSITVYTEEDGHCHRVPPQDTVPFSRCPRKWGWLGGPCYSPVGVATLNPSWSPPWRLGLSTKQRGFALTAPRRLLRTTMVAGSRFS